MQMSAGEAKPCRFNFYFYFLIKSGFLLPDLYAAGEESYCQG